MPYQPQVATNNTQLPHLRGRQRLLQGPLLRIWQQRNDRVQGRPRCSPVHAASLMIGLALDCAALDWLPLAVVGRAAALAAMAWLGCAGVSSAAGEVAVG